MKYSKAVTFSFDDGHTVDRKLIEILNKYNLKATINLNSGTMVKYCGWRYKGKDYFKIEPDEAKELYKGHEIASHGLCHGALMNLNDENVDKEIKCDIAFLEEIFSEKIEGFVYACGNYDERTLAKLKECGIKYARKVQTTKSYALPTGSMLECEYSFCVDGCLDSEEFHKVVDDFLNSNDNEPKLLSLWGHAFAQDGNELWDKFEGLCKKISGKSDILYGTNSEVFKNFGLIEQ